MSQTSTRLALPYLMPAQAQKHVTHNTALERLDVLVQLVVQGFDATTPPVSLTEGEVHALGTGATGAWLGQDGQLAAFLGGGWVFVTPAEGWQAVQSGTATLRILSGGSWQAVGENTQNLTGVGINTTSDATNRLAVAAPATLLSHEGAGHQLKINKAAAGDTGSLLYQTNWSGRAEMGLTGNDDFVVKVSADGNSWATALQVAGATGHVSAPQLSSGRVTIADNAVALIPTPSVGGFVLLTITDELYPQVTHSGVLVYDTGGSLSLMSLAKGSKLELMGSTTLTGTSAVDGNSGVAVAAGQLQVENRSGSARDYSYTFIGGM